MTLVLTLANRDQTIVLADRRLTSSGKVVDEECAKCGAIVFRDARLAFGFTGIARSLGLEVRRWLLDALLHEAKPDYLAHQTLERLRVRATHDFSSLNAFARLSAEDRRFCILFTGYLDQHDPPIIGSAILSNFVRPDTREFLPHAGEEFVTIYEQEKQGRRADVTHIQRVGATGALSSKSIGDLQQALVCRKPAKAIVSIATDVMLRASQVPQAGETVGRQISWLRVPVQRTMSTETGYYSSVPTFQTFMPSYACLEGPESAWVMDTGWMGPVGDDRQPIAVPRVGRNVPCPCGSGKKYNHCHGRR